jgi:hypothetical protein
VAKEFLEGRITADEAKELAQFLKATIEIYEERAYEVTEDGDLFKDVMLKAKLAEIKAAHRRQAIDKKAGKAVWQS